MMNAEAYTGGCLCGAVRYRVSGVDIASLAGVYCHCSMCRKATGGGFATFVPVPRGALQWVARAPDVFRSSPLATRGFCRTCGSPLYYAADAEDFVSITAGSLDDPSAFRPDHHYGTESRLAWVDCGPDLPGRETEERFEGQPGS